ncbi:hypothetical protein [Parachitinimonas caeni]|uniref:Uncharacterized protein n=1 Tax=Parachitinimonas caeni TaxID=3031301 RepID=A0ABT7E2D4_9NEIS|nr:hypothetical protein [Parachitinimonas caeni]MDK2126472.1 hypothetical protein [Parachitinimonas caeni]
MLDRLEDFHERNPDRPVVAPLIEAGLCKADCKAMLERAGSELPMMYRLGYDNANCIGCVRGGEGYWRAIREDFPAQFEAICQLQDEIGEGSWFLRYRSGPHAGQRFPMRNWPAGTARRIGLCGVTRQRETNEYSRQRI